MPWSRILPLCLRIDSCNTITIFKHKKEDKRNAVYWGYNVVIKAALNPIVTLCWEEKSDSVTDTEIFIWHWNFCKYRNYMYKILAHMLFVKFNFRTCNKIKQIPNKLCSHLHTKLMHLLVHTRANYVTNM